jgi:hypothetical protein
MPTELAFFTPTQITGAGYWIDFWNADLFWGMSEANRIVQNDAVLFRRDDTTWTGKYRVGGPNGVIQARFSLPRDDYVLVALKLSASGAYFQIYIDDTFAGWGVVNSVGQVFPFLMNVKAGGHSLTVLQGPFQVRPKDHLWFHSITLFTI